MGLIINKHLVRSIQGRHMGTAFGVNTSTQNVWGRNKLQYFAKFVSIPSGTRPPHSFIMAQSNGGISLRLHTTLDSVLCNLAGGINIDVLQNLSLDAISIRLDRIVSMLANGNINLIKLDAKLSAAANILMNSSAHITSSVSIGAIIDIIVIGLINGNKNINMTALAHLESNIGGPTPLSPEGLARAVWGALAEDNNIVGTMGQKLNTASSGGVDIDALSTAIWNKLSSEANSTDSMGKLINDIYIELNKKLNTGTFIALK